ncbi:Bifunctional dethiobiotin synthetase/7,8-diamino-pelargonic acid aminotransferase, mitochondrial [Salvia divinorum]|uniref:Bifunctional dethiobiotin synthetase/7,8-diamino-pelargonic acid aminotransferase, mitochondrial n=1 Tax=Salvia divinorum TaxID=28513 RepID=A0ABD1HPN6_SALDI
MAPFTVIVAATLRRSLFKHSHFRRRCLHSAIDYPLSHPIYTIWASNTSLGKTLVSAGLSISFLSSSSSSPSFPKRRFVYLKPIQTGFPHDSDSAFLYRKFCQFYASKSLPFSVFASNSVFRASYPAANEVLGNASLADGGEGLKNLHWYEERKLQGTDGNGVEQFPVWEAVCKTLYAWKEAVSPHLAAERESAMVSDSEVLDLLRRCLENDIVGKSATTEEVEVMSVIETAGGVASPGPSGSLQCDLYRPFRLPGILVGDGRLGGISGTISAYESLTLRGYDIAAVVFEDHGLMNEVPLLSYFRNRVPVLVLPSIPKDMSDDLISWFDKSQTVFTSLKEIMLSTFLERTRRLHEMPKKSCDAFWWPFTQHKLVSEEKVTVIDSRCGENFAVLKSSDIISEQFDACASWWTQGPDANLQLHYPLFLGAYRLNLLKIWATLLQGVGKGWASRVYYSDNGSTAVEIALKMAFRKFLSDHEMLSDNVSSDENGNCMDLKVLALRGSYHGDTLGAMEAQAPSSYTGFLQQPWYSGRGLFLDPPTVALYSGTWKVSLPQKMKSVMSGCESLSFSSRDEIFKRSRNGSGLASLYTSSILQELELLSDCNALSYIGALIVEPVVQGAGGMQMIDPLYQRTLVMECKRRKIPVIFDEVFTGFWRLGRETAAEMLYCEPDISCFAKLMTGGIIPLAATLASEATFEAFTGDSKLKALLHGHSYSAHAMGCAAAVKSIQWFKDCNTNMNLIPESRLLQEVWDPELVVRISLLPAVHRVVSLGTLCAIEIQAEGSNAGYASTYASSLLQTLRGDGIYMRPLGNVVYLMCGPCTPRDTCRHLLDKVYSRIHEFGQQKDQQASAA